MIDVCLFFIYIYVAWAVISDEQMSNGYPSSLCHAEQI